MTVTSYDFSDDVNDNSNFKNNDMKDNSKCDKELVKLQRITIHKKNTRLKLIDLTKKLSELADYVDNSQKSSKSISCNLVSKKPRKNRSNQKVKQRRETWDQTMISRKFFDTHTSPESKVRKTTHNFMDTKYEIKEVFDEAADENGLKINLNLCPKLEEDVEKLQQDDKQYSYNSTGCVSSWSGSSLSNELVKTSSSKSKRKRRKTRKYTINEFTSACELSNQNHSSPLDKMTSAKVSQRWNEHNFSSFTLKGNVYQSIDQMSNQSPDSRGSAYNDHFQPHFPSKILKTKSEHAKRLTMPKENMLNIIDR